MQVHHRKHQKAAFLYQGFDTNIEALVPSNEDLRERGIPNGRFIRERDELRGFHITRFDLGLTITATVQAAAGLVSLDLDSLFSPLRSFLDDDADEALDKFIGKFDKPLLQEPFSFMLWKAPKLALVKNPDTCKWDIVQEEEAVGFDIMDYTEYKDLSCPFSKVVILSERTEKKR